ncbi:MAG TPA: ArsC/Spx/MgsR family protein [Planctomycetota bacterium]|nr:ArsC/Spx/MgsR family protein [Planctomycetota bacterium]
MIDLLRERGVEFDVINYMEVKLSRDTLETLIALVGDPTSCVRTDDPAFKESGLSAPLTAEQALEFLCEHPETMQRPIVTDGKRAIICRPAEKVLPWLDQAAQAK